MLLPRIRSSASGGTYSISLARSSEYSTWCMINFKIADLASAFCSSIILAWKFIPFSVNYVIRFSKFMSKIIPFFVNDTTECYQTLRQFFRPLSAFMSLIQLLLSQRSSVENSLFSQSFNPASPLQIMIKQYSTSQLSFNWNVFFFNITLEQH